MHRDPFFTLHSKTPPREIAAAFSSTCRPGRPLPVFRSRSAAGDLIRSKGTRAHRTRLPVSRFIIAQNEADRSAWPTAPCVRWLPGRACRSGSTDATQDVARSEGARVVFNAWPGFGQQKRFGEMQCRNDWLLNLDADEVVSSELADELREQLAARFAPYAVYGVDVLDVYPGRDRPRIWARDHHYLRLYDRRRVRFKDSTLFDSVDPGSEARRPPQRCHHFPCARSTISFPRLTFAPLTMRRMAPPNRPGLCSCGSSRNFLSPF